MKSIYQAFLTVLGQSSFSEAARVMGYTQSAVSQMIKGLETELGVTLLQRSHAGVSLTPEGEALLPYLREAANADRALHDQAAALRGLEQGAVRIGTFTSVSSGLLPRAIKRFKEQHPGITFELHQGLYPAMEAWVRDGVVDFSFTDLSRPTEHGSEALFVDALMLVMATDHPLSAMERVPVEMLRDEPFILLEEGRGGASITQFLADHPALNVQYRVADDYSVLNMVENHLGVALVPEIILHHTTHRVISRHLDPPLLRSMGIIYRQRAGLGTAARAFVQTLHQVIEEDWEASLQKSESMVH